MRTSAKRVARAIYEISRNHKERLFSNPTLAIDATPEKYQIAETIFSVAGTAYRKAAATAIAFTAAHPVEEGKYGAILIEINTSGTPASKISGATQTTIQSYASAAAAVAALPAVTASKRALGHIVIHANHKYASLSTNLTGNNNDLVYTAVASGTAGNSVKVEYIDPAANDQVLSVTVLGSTITVNLATDGGGTITTTADDIKAAIALVPAAVALVGTVVDKGGNDGSGVVTAMDSTAGSLSGGTATGWTAATDDMTDASDVVTATFVSYFGTNSRLSDIGSSWVEKSAAFQEARAGEVLEYLHTGVVPTLDSTVDQETFLAVVDSLRNKPQIT